MGVTGTRRRFARYGVLRGIASSASFRELLVFKGGNALDFVWSPNRSTFDLDFSVDMSKRERQELAEGQSKELLSRGLAVSGREDIVAEKLRAFLQQKETIRNRERPQDLLDIAHLLRQNTPLDLGEVSRFLLEKAEARNVPVSKAAFKDPELAARASYGYEGLRETVRGDFVPFNETLQRLHGLVEELDIPEE